MRFVDLDEPADVKGTTAGVAALSFAPDLGEGTGGSPRWYDATSSMTSSASMAARKKTSSPEELALERRREQLRKAQSDARLRAAARRSGAERSLKSMDRKISGLARSMAETALTLPPHHRELVSAWESELGALRKAIELLLDDVRLPRAAKAKSRK